MIVIVNYNGSQRALLLRRAMSIRATCSANGSGRFWARRTNSSRRSTGQRGLETRIFGLNLRPNWGDKWPV